MSYGDGSERSRCSPRDYGELTCQGGLVCAKTEVCIKPHKVGEACEIPGECESHSCENGVCLAGRCGVH